MNEIAKRERTAFEIAVEINAIKEQTMRTVAAASFEIGKRLCEAKAIVPAGEWLSYLQERLDYKPSTAENLMRIYREYGDEQVDLITGKAPAEIFSGLNQSQMVAMFALDPAERAELVQQTPGIEDMSSRQIADMAKELKEAKAEAARERKARENADQIAVSKANELDKLKSQAHGNEQRITDLQQELQAARDDLEQAKNQQTIVQEQQADVSAYEKRIEDLQKKLKDAESKQASSVTDEERESIRKEYEHELAAAKAKAAAVKQLAGINFLFRELQEKSIALREKLDECDHEQVDGLRSTIARTLRELADGLEKKV